MLGGAVPRGRILGALLVSGLAMVLAPAAHASFPGENGKIAFSYCGAVDCGIFVMEPDGSRRTQITHNPYVRTDRFGTSPMRDHAPAWSAQGDRIAFEREVPQANPQIVVANADGSNLQSLGEGNDPAWSPDGTKIAFWTFGGTLGSNGIFVMNSDGTGVTRIVQGMNARGPDWSPDGTRIAYSDSRQEGWQDPEIWVVPATGGTPTSLTPPDFSQGSASPRSFNFGPSWSPDAARVAFASSVPGSQWDVFTIGADGTGRQQVTFTDAVSGESEENVSWSPDGTRIAYERHLGTAPAGIVVTGADGTGETFLGPGFETSWQPLPANNDPDCTAVRATPSSLGAPNHRLLTVTVSGATDSDGDTVDLEITGVTQDERMRGPADAVATTEPNRVRLRAERDPKGDGRVYRIAFEANDGRGGTCTGFATASVRKGTRAVDSAPPSYDSFGS